MPTPDPSAPETPPAKPAAKAKRSLPVKIGRGVVWTLLGIILLVAVLLLAVELILRTSYAEEKIASVIDVQAKKAIAGQLKLGKVSVRGALEVCARGVDLKDPDGVPAIQAKSICVSLDAAALIHKEIHVKKIELEEPLVFLTTESEKTTSLQRAFAPREPKPKSEAKAAPFTWSILLDALSLKNGGFEQRDAPDAKPKLAVHGLDIGPAQARYSQTGAQARLSLEGELQLVGEEKVKVSVDAQLDGTLTGGRATLRGLQAQLGSSGFKADGAVDLTALSGALHVHDLLIEPADLDTLLGQLPLAAELKGEAEISSDGKAAHAAVQVQSERGGRINLTAQSTLAEPPRWSMKLETEHVDPSFIVRGGPPGHVSLVLGLEGKGIPKLDEKGIEGDVSGSLHLGPAELKATGALSADADFSLLGRSALVKKLDADALAIHIHGKGSLSLRALALDLQIDADNLGRFAHELGALQHKKPIALSGEAHVTAHVTGSPEKPDAQLHLRSPAFALGAGLRVDGLAIDGTLKGPLRRPQGELVITSKSMAVSGIGLGAPKIDAQVDWPQAHLEIDAAVGQSRGDLTASQGAIHLEGDAEVDEDRDGAVLSGFRVSWPGNELTQEQLARIHFRATETVLETFALKGKRGDLSLSATLRPPPAPLPHHEPGPSSVVAKLALEKFELGGVPAFVLPPNLHLAGSIDLHAEAEGLITRPDVKASIALHGVEVQNAHGLDGELTAALERDRLRAQGTLSGVAGAKLSLRADLPIETEAAPESPVELDLTLGPIDLSQLPQLVQRQELYLAKPAGQVTLHATAEGTLEKPRAEISIEAKKVAWQKFHDLGLRTKLTAEGSRAKLDAEISIEETSAVTLTAEAPFDLSATLRKPALFEHVFEKPASAKLRIAGLQLALLGRAGILPPTATGEVTASLDLGGTPTDPQLTLEANGKQLSYSALQNLDLAVHLSAAQKMHVDVEARPGGEARARLDLTTEIAAPEVVALARKGFSKATLYPLLDRALELQIDIEKLVLGSLSSTGKAQIPLRGELDGSITGTGTPNAPELKGNLTLHEVEAGPHALGDAEVYLEGDKTGATLHIGLAPPSAAELNARASAAAQAAAPKTEAEKVAMQINSADPQAVKLEEEKEEQAKAQAEKPGMEAMASSEASRETAKEKTAEIDADEKRAAEEKEAREPATGMAARRAAARRKLAAAPKRSSGMTQRGGGTFLGHAQLKAPLSARTLIDQGMEAIAQGDLDGTVTMRNLDLAFLSGLTPSLRRTGGVIDGEVSLHGLLDRPEPTGEAHLVGGVFDVVGQGIFEDVAFDATFTPKEIVLERVSGSTGGGTFSSTFVVDRKTAQTEAEDDQFQFNGELHAGDAESVRDRKGADGKPLVARPLPIRQAGEERADLTAEVDFFGDDTSGNITAAVKIPSAKVRVGSLPDKKLPSLTPNPEVLVSKAGEAPHPAGIDTEALKKQKEAMAQRNLRVDLKLELDKLQVSADDFDFPVTSKMHLSWDAQHPDTPSADGTVEVSGGTFSALGRRFTIDEAKITEIGGDIVDPELEIQARYENAQASVLVLVSGTAKDPQVDLSSSPPMDQDAIAFFLATGRLQGQATQQGSDVDLGSAATSVLGAVLFGKLRSNMADIMPVDVVDIEAGGGDRPPEASVGKYIGDKIFIGYRQRFAPAPTENESEGTVEYAIIRGLGASATVGEKNQGVMVTLTKDF